jgi:hypothetical protein
MNKLSHSKEKIKWDANIFLSLFTEIEIIYLGLEAGACSLTIT